MQIVNDQLLYKFPIHHIYIKYILDNCHFNVYIKDIPDFNVYIKDILENC